MRLLSIIENIADEYGGPANSLPNLLDAIRRELSIESMIYSISRSDNENNEFIERFSISWFNFKGTGLNKIRYSKGLRKKLVEDIRGGDILFSNNLWNYPAYLAYNVSRKNNIAHIISIRGALYPWSLSQGAFRKKIALFFFQKAALQNASLIHVTCYEEHDAVRELGITTPIAIVPHGINYDDYQNLTKKSNAIASLKLRDDKKYILFMSRLHKKKGLDVLLDIWPDLAKKNPNWCLLVVGPDYSGYAARISQLSIDQGVQHNIKVLGMLTGRQKKNAFACSEFFVLPSHSENFGVVIGEALASGLPTISTTGTPWAEIATHKCGKYITLTPENLSHSLQEMMMLDESSLEVMSDNGKSLIKERYTWSAQALKFGKALEFVLTGKPAPGVVYLNGEKCLLD